MKYMIYCVMFMLLFSMSYGQVHQKQFYFGKKNNLLPAVSDANVTFLEFAKSVAGPFSSALTVYPTDSLFARADVTPMGALLLTYYADINENDVIDPDDMPIGIEVVYDNNTMPPGSIDLDPMAGRIVCWIETENTPSMTIIALVTEDDDSVTAKVTFLNPPAQYTLSGHVYDQDGIGLGGAWVFVSGDSGTVADGTDTLGYYSIPLDSGNYHLQAEHISGVYGSFDTSFAVSGNTTIDITLSLLDSYIRGYVRDEDSNPIANVEIWGAGGGYTMTDGNGMYLVMIPAGSGVIGLNEETLLPNYLTPSEHVYTIGEGDSIVNNSVSNFTCYTVNSTITGQVFENGSAPSRSYEVFGWSSELQSHTLAISDPSTGNYSLPVHTAMTMPLYTVSIQNYGNGHPWLPGHYPDTSYSIVSPGSSGMNFNMIPAETLFTESFNGHMIPPNWNEWAWYNNGSINFGGSDVMLENDRIRIRTESSGGTSGLGVMTSKPYRIQDREYRILVDNSLLTGTNNSVRIMLSDRQWYSDAPQGFENSLQLVYERNMYNDRQWRLMRTINGVGTNLWTSSDSSGHHILFQFIQPDTLVLKVHGIEDYRGPWGNHLSMAYLYLTTFNTYGESVSPAYFDEIIVGPVGLTGVREISGPLPREFSVGQNYPNPFNPATVIRYEIPEQSRVAIDVYNVLGEHVASLVNGLQNAGIYEVSFNGNQLPSGVYYYRVNATDAENGILKASNIKKAILIK